MEWTPSGGQVSWFNRLDQGMDQDQGPTSELPDRQRRPYRRHDEDIKATVIARCLDGDEAVVAVAAQLGVSDKTAWVWVDNERMRRLDPDGKLPPEVRQRLVQEQQKVAKLEQQNAELQRQLEFAKKAGAFFRETDRRGTDTR